jgi:hypothetical protein
MSAMNDVNNIKVKCFNSHTMTDIENSMNTWLTKNNIYVVDIKFSTMQDNSFRYYSVLVIYRED